METLFVAQTCKYCQENLKPCLDEGLQCAVCRTSVHSRCLKRGSVPGGIHGDLFYIFTCQECSVDGQEKFVRENLSWMQTILLTLYHLKTKSSGLARNGFFHWRNHIVSFIDRNWQIFYPTEKPRKKKKWIGTVSGRLSYYSTYLFLSGSKTALNKPAWWTLMYPKLTPFVVSTVYNVMTAEKLKSKPKNEKKLISDAEFFNALLNQYVNDQELTQTFDLSIKTDGDLEKTVQEMEAEKRVAEKRKTLATDFMEPSRKLIKLASALPLSLSDTVALPAAPEVKPAQSSSAPKESLRLLDPMCYYNTSLNNISRIKMQKLLAKLTGGVRSEMILSPYSGIYLKPYIRRDSESFPTWLKLMAELQLAANKNNPDYILPPRGVIDYAYVQPEHIPAINSLCNQFFWPGIDMAEALQYPEFSCVVLYKRLIIGFAFLVPNVTATESYISFMFVRPGWRRCGIAKFMLYHLIMTSLGKDITLHVSMNNPAMILYQQFSFKIEKHVLNFYDKYYRDDNVESKHAFFCRLLR